MGVSNIGSVSARSAALAALSAAVAAGCLDFQPLQTTDDGARVGADKSGFVGGGEGVGGATSATGGSGAGVGGAGGATSATGGGGSGEGVGGAGVGGAGVGGAGVGGAISGTGGGGSSEGVADAASGTGGGGSSEGVGDAGVGGAPVAPPTPATDDATDDAPDDAIDEGGETCPGPDGVSLRPLCLAPGECLDVSCQTRNLVALWLDASSLPSPGQAPTGWEDKSGKGNHAVGPETEPHMYVVYEDRAGSLPRKAAGLDSVNLKVQRSSSLALGGDDFTILVSGRTAPSAVLARELITLASFDFGGQDMFLSVGNDGELIFMGAYLTAESVSVYFELESSGVRFDDGCTHLFGLRRVGSTFEMRADGQVLESYEIEGQGEFRPFVPSHAPEDLPTPVFGARAPSRSSLSAAVTTRGVMPEEDLVKLEQLLLKLSGCGSETASMSPTSNRLEPLSSPDDR